MSPQDRQVWQIFVRLADTLVDDFDVIDFLDALVKDSIDLLGVTASGILLADHTGALNLVAASAEQARILELLQLQNAEGPCLDAYRTRAQVQCPDLAAAGERWPVFAPAALDAGFAAVHALPMRLREQAVGGMNLFSARPGALSTRAAELGQALADVATVGILHERTLRRHGVVTEQLQRALSSRIVIEQAKGVLAERLGLPIADAFTVLRRHARNHNLKLADVAGAITEGTLDVTQPADTATPLDPGQGGHRLITRRPPGSGGSSRVQGVPPEPGPTRAEPPLFHRLHGAAVPRVTGRHAARASLAVAEAPAAQPPDHETARARRGRSRTGGRSRICGQARRGARPGRPPASASDEAAGTAGGKHR